MNNYVYKKKLCMTEFHIVKMHFRSPHFFDTDVGQAHSSFVYVAEGNLTINSSGTSIHVEKGELLFMPEGLRYTALWQGAPEIMYYSLRIISKQVDTSNSAGGFALQKVTLEDGTDVGAEIAEIFRLFETAERVNMLTGMGRYYCLYAKILPHLREAVSMAYSVTAVKATAYIDKHFSEDFSMEELAAACQISESRLYHIFRQELGTTPTKYRNILRIEHAAADLRIAGLTIDEVAEKNGFHSAAYFRESFKTETGLTPTEYRRMAQCRERPAHRLRYNCKSRRLLPTV